LTGKKLQGFLTSLEEAFKKSNEHDESVDAAYQEGRAEGEWWRVE